MLAPCRRSPHEGLGFAATAVRSHDASPQNADCSLRCGVAIAASTLGPAAAQAHGAAPSVTDVAVSSNAGSDQTYALGETIVITVSFSEAVLVTGTPQIAIDMDPAFWGTKWAVYQEGTGTASLTFAHTVVRPNYSTQGIAVLENTLRLNGGTITSAASPAAADLGHDGLAHDADHKVNWQLTPPAPTVTAVAVSSNPGDSSTYNLGDTIRVAVSFSEAVSVTGTPQIAIDMDPAFWGTKWAAYETGSGTATLTFAHTVVQPNYSTQGIAVLENTLRLNGGTISAAASPAAADLAHGGLAHDAGHKVDWQIAPPAEPACELTAPSSVEALTIGQGAVVSWTLPDMDDACDVSGFTITAVNDDPTLGSLTNHITDPDARSHTLRGLDPGDYRFSVSIEYAEGDSEELVTAQANSVPDACMTLAVQPYSHNAISGKIASVNGTGCMARETFEIEIKRTADDFWDTHGRFTYPGRLEDNPFRPAWSIVNPDFANQPDFIFASREPYVGYDFRIAAYDASGSKYTTNPASATIVADDPADTADANSPGSVRVWADNNDGLMVSWGAATVAAGRTLSAYVVEWTTADGTAMTKEIESGSSSSSEFGLRRTRITGLTNDVRYTVRVAARSHPNGQPSNTSDAWSVRAPGVRTWSEPTQLWFANSSPNHNSVVGRVFMQTGSNKAWGAAECSVTSKGESGTINCPDATLVSLDAAGAITVNGSSSLGASTTSVGAAGGPTPPAVYASAGAAPSDDDANTHEGRIVVAWGAAGGTSVVGSIDAYIVQHRLDRNEQGPERPLPHHRQPRRRHLPGPRAGSQRRRRQRPEHHRHGQAGLHLRDPDAEGERGRHRHGFAADRRDSRRQRVVHCPLGAARQRLDAPRLAGPPPAAGHHELDREPGALPSHDPPPMQVERQR